MDEFAQTTQAVGSHTHVLFLPTYPEGSVYPVFRKQLETLEQYTECIQIEQSHLFYSREIKYLIVKKNHETIFLDSRWTLCFLKELAKRRLIERTNFN